MVEAAMKRSTRLFNQGASGMIFAYHHAWGPVKRSVRNAYSYVLFLKRERRFIGDGDHKKTISLLCPTRGRPKQAIRLMRSIRRTAAVPKRIELLFYIDSDDEEKDRYLALLDRAKAKLEGSIKCEAFVGDPISVSKSWNILAEKSRGDFLAMANDDQVYVDFGWDVRLEKEAEKFPDQIYCFCFNVGHQASSEGAFPIVSRRWVDALGYFTPGIFQFAANDMWIMDIAKSIDRFYYFSDVLVEHLHCVYKKSRYDKTYKRNRRTDIYSSDYRLLREGVLERKRAAEKLTDLMNHEAKEHSP